MWEIGKSKNWNPNQSLTIQSRDHERKPDSQFTPRWETTRGVGESSSNPTSSNTNRHNHRRSKQPFILEESPVDTMADQRTMAELLRVPTEGYAKAIVVPPILAEKFELKHSRINMMTSDQFFRLEKDNPHDHIHQFFRLEKDNPHDHIRAARRWLEKRTLSFDSHLGRFCFHIHQ
nr:hypothetical protein [Tanacetum cinerariifolium]